MGFSGTQLHSSNQSHDWLKNRPFCFDDVPSQVWWQVQQEGQLPRWVKVGLGSQVEGLKRKQWFWLSSKNGSLAIPLPSLTTPALPCGVFCSKQWLETYVKFIAIHGKLGPNFEILSLGTCFWPSFAVSSPPETQSTGGFGSATGDCIDQTGISSMAPRKFWRLVLYSYEGFHKWGYPQMDGL